MEETVAKPGLFKKPLPATLVGWNREGQSMHTSSYDFESLDNGAV